MTPAAPGMARRFVGTLGRLVPRGRLDDLCLITSELVSNSVLHSGLGRRDWVLLKLEVAGRAVRIEVSDTGRGFGHRPGDPLDQSGWGLSIVDHLADRWGLENGSRTTVWAELGSP